MTDTDGIKAEFERVACKPSYGCHPEGCVCAVVEDCLERIAELEEQVTEIPTICRRYEGKIAELEAAIKDAIPMLYGYRGGPRKAELILYAALKEQSNAELDKYAHEPEGEGFGGGLEP